MPDLLVPLYSLPENIQLDSSIIRLVAPWESNTVVTWIQQNFEALWANEASVAIHQQPSKCLIALQNNTIVGFACFDTTARGFFGPTGVKPDCQGQGIGKALLIESMHRMRSLGFGYAIIGDAGPVEFYSKLLEVFEIPNSTPGIYHDKISG